MTEKSIETNSLLTAYVKRVDAAIENHLDLLGPPSPVRDACAYALSTGGKRVRPSITLMVADALGGMGNVTLSALSIEYFHTASLVVDDMPSMDNDDERRSQPSVHKKFGEAAALLVSYGLIGAGYGMIAENGRLLLDQNVSFVKSVDLRCRLALENASFNTGLNGATGGQFLDIRPPDLSTETLKKIIHMKTSSLFEVAFVNGWLFGGGALEKLDQVKQAAAHFGLAFQIADDLGDMEQDLRNKREVNLANVFSKGKAVDMFHGELQSFHLILKDLGLDEEFFSVLTDSLKASF